MCQVVGRSVELNEAVIGAGGKVAVVLIEHMRAVDPVELLARGTAFECRDIVPPHAEPEIVPVGQDMNTITDDAGRKLLCGNNLECERGGLRLDGRRGAYRGGAEYEEEY